MKMPVANQSERHILIIDLSKRFGGASTRALTLARNLHPWRVSLVCLKDSPVAKAAEDLGISVEVVGGSRVDPRILFRLVSIIRKGSYEILDTQNVQSQFWGSLAAWLTGISLVSTLNSWYRYEHGGNWRGKLYTAIELGTQWQTAHYIAVSEEVQAALVSAGIQNDRISLIRNAIEIVSDPTPQDQNELRLPLGIASGSIVCLAVGRLVWAKGFDLLIESFAMVAKIVPNVILLIVGDGPLRSKLEEQVQTLGLQQHIHFLGYHGREFVLKILSAGDIFVMPSRTEGTPLALLEAAILGLPIVATHCGGIPEIVTNNSEAILVSVGDSAGLSDSIVRLCRNPRYARELGMRAKLKVERDFSPKVQAHNTQQVYLKILERSYPTSATRNLIHDK